MTPLQSWQGFNFMAKIAQQLAVNELAYIFVGGYHITFSLLYLCCLAINACC